MCVTVSGSLMHFDNLFGLLVMLYITLMMTVAAVETSW
jgi:hypothetical protein